MPQLRFDGYAPFVFVACLASFSAFSSHAQQTIDSRTGSPADLAGELRDAEKLSRSGKFSAAIDRYNTLIAEGTQAGVAYAGLSRVYLREKQPAEARAAADKASQLAPASPETRVALAEVAFREGNIGAAESEFMDVINAGTTNARAYLGMAKVSRASSLYKQAKEMIDKARSLDPADPDIERFWLSTLPLRDRIHALEDHLSHETDDSAEVHEGLESELAMLRDQATRKTRACRLSTKVTSTQSNFVPLLEDSSHLHGYGLHVELNGTSGNLLLDTGAGGIVVNKKLADKAGVRRVAQSTIRGAGDQGGAAGYIGYVDSIKIGELAFDDCYVTVVEKRSVIDEDGGLIGGDVFSDFLVDLDFAAGKFRLGVLPVLPGETPTDASLDSQEVSGAPTTLYNRYQAPEMKQYSPLFRFGHILLIPTSLNDLPPKLFVIDSGSLGSMISPEAAREVTKVSASADSQVTGLSGRVNEVFRANEVTLTFAHLRQKNLDLAAYDTKSLGDSLGTEVSGILGFATLRMLDIKIDYRDGLIDFNFDSKLW